MVINARPRHLARAWDVALAQLGDQAAVALILGPTTTWAHARPTTLPSQLRQTTILLAGKFDQRA
ncbi:MAG: hypothetical protein ACLP8S_10135 [Solirubrobacteraceae bacterium]